MGIEGGFKGGPRIENQPSIKIEGEPIGAFIEATIDQADPVQLEDIEWPQFSAGLHFKKVSSYLYKRLGYTESYPLYTCLSWFKNGNSTKKIDLTYTTSQKQCLFTGSRNGFFMHNPEWAGKQTDFYVIGVNPFELEDDIRQHSGTYHELEHACIVDRGLDTQLYQAALSLKAKQLPKVAMAQAYGNILANAIPDSWRNSEYQPLIEAMSANYNVSLAIKLFHERNAWAGGIRLENVHGFPTGFQQKTSLGEYAKFWLQTYAIAHNDSRFVKGLR